MVDYDLFKQILEKKDEGYISSEDYVDFRLIEFLANYQIEPVKKLFKKSDGSDYRYQKRCIKCGGLDPFVGSKTSLMDYINSVRQGKEIYLCPECYEKKKASAQLERLFSEIEQNKQRKKNTEEYIKTYLDPENSWKKNLKPWEKRRTLLAYLVDWDEIKDYILNMDYHDFLMTPYWKGVADYVKHFNNHKCQLCNGTDGLSVHHKTYENHGDEIHNMKDLVCLCYDCHQKFHDKGAYEKGK